MLKHTKYTFPYSVALTLVLRKDVIVIGRLQKLNYEYGTYAMQQIVTYIDNDAGHGYIWRINGWVKTLTSPKSSTLFKENALTTNALSWLTSKYNLAGQPINIKQTPPPSGSSRKSSSRLHKGASATVSDEKLH